MRKGTTNKKTIRISICRMILRNSFLNVQAVKGKETRKCQLPTQDLCAKKWHLSVLYFCFTGKRLACS